MMRESGGGREVHPFDNFLWVSIAIPLNLRQKLAACFRLGAAGDLARLNVGRRRHLSFEDARSQ